MNRVVRAVRRGTGSALRIALSRPSNPGCFAAHSIGFVTLPIKTYVINLDRSPDRMAFMQGQLDRLGIEYERFPAIDGRELRPPVPGVDERSYARLHGRRFHPGEVGCYLSHMQVLRRFLATDAPFALVLEDDGLIHESLPKLIEVALKEPRDWDILRLSTVNGGAFFPYRRIDQRFSFALPLTRKKGSAAYLLSRNCAKRLLEKMDPMRFAYDIAFDTEFLMGVKMSFIYPPPVDQHTDMVSQIQIDGDRFKLPATRYFTVFPWRSWVETNRFLRRLAQLAALLLRLPIRIL
jgi:glycosyl transferase, family 25